MQFSNGYDMSFDFNMDWLGVIYITVATIWTLALTLGSVFLFRNRELPYLRIRNVPLAVGGVATLHVYLVLCMVAYVLNGNFPCATEFWIMSIYLPLGIALYQAANTQLLHVAMLQKKFAPRESTGGDDSTIKKPTWRIILQKIREHGPTKRTLHLIGIGMAIQFFFALIVFLISRKFHQSFGTIDWVDRPDDERQEAMACRRGWEWWPSIAWQFAWSWLYAPYLLFKVRNIDDTHGWRLQTIVCCIAGLPASPMWLAALYIPGMKPTTRTFVAPLWFAPSIILMQGFCIFVPCYQVYKNRRLENETRQIIAEWESKKRHGNAGSGDSTQVGSKYSSSRSLKSNRDPSMYTLSSLESALLVNPKPLLLFAALKDFSGENISFLTHINEWKAGWTIPSPAKVNFLRKPEINRQADDRLRRRQFGLALRIYSSFVSLRYSEFPINISSVHLKELDMIFSEPAAKLNKCSDHNAATPFDDYDDAFKDLEHDAGMSRTTTVTSSHAMVDIMSCPEQKHYSQVQALQLGNADDDLPADIQTPPGFGPSTFDRAEASIRELVLTNTWPKFVNSGHFIEAEKPSLKDRVSERIGEVGGILSKAVESVTPKRKGARVDDGEGVNSDQQKLV